jgi:hypothetical protein
MTEGIILMALAGVCWLKLLDRRYTRIGQLRTGAAGLVSLMVGLGLLTGALFLEYVGAAVFVVFVSEIVYTGRPSRGTDKG